MDAAAFLLDIFFPPECVACGGRLAHGTLCTACRIGIAPHRSAFCGACGATLPGLQNICHPRVPYLLGAAGEYGDPPLRALIHALKFEKVRSAAEPLADILAHYCACLPLDLQGAVVVPVPISPQRMRERGFNQSALIARRFAQFFGLPCDEKTLARIRHRGPQSEIADRAARKRNIEGCYAVIRKDGSTAAVPRKVLLIDDVTTSGATFTEASHALRQSGAKKIFALAAAKAIAAGASG